MAQQQHWRVVLVFTAFFGAVGLAQDLAHDSRRMDSCQPFI